MEETKFPTINEEIRVDDNKFVMALIEEKLKEIYDLTFLLQGDRNGVTIKPFLSIKSYIRMAYDEAVELMTNKENGFKFKGHMVPTFQEIYTHKMKTDSLAAHAIVNELRMKMEK